MLIQKMLFREMIEVEAFSFTLGLRENDSSPQGKLLYGVFTFSPPEKPSSTFPSIKYRKKHAHACNHLQQKK